MTKSYSISPKEASEIVGLHLRTIYDWIKKKRISYRKIKVKGREIIRLNEEEIREIAKERSKPSNEADQVITIPREEYNQLIFRIGFLEAEKQRKLEIEEQAQSLREEKSQLQEENERLRRELEARSSWWDKFKGWWRGE